MVRSRVGAHEKHGDTGADGVAELHAALLAVEVAHVAPLPQHDHDDGHLLGKQVQQNRGLQDVAVRTGRRRHAANRAAPSCRACSVTETHGSQAGPERVWLACDSVQAQACAVLTLLCWQACKL